MTAAPPDESDDRGEVTLLWWGEIDLDNAHRYRGELLAAVRDADAVFVDMTGVTFIDSLGLGVLVAGWKQACAQAVGFTVHVPEGSVHRAMKTAGLLGLLNRRGS